MRTLWQDLHYGARMLLKSPGFTFVAVLALALGIGANTAIFSVVNAVLLKPLPFNNPQRIVAVWDVNVQKNNSQSPVAPAKFVDLREQSRSFEQVAAIYAQDLNLTDTDEPESLSASLVTSGFFEALGASPAFGRAFTPEEDTYGSQRAVILSHSLWQRRFGADRNIVGRQVGLSKESYTVVGVMPAGFEYPAETDVWVAAAFAPDLYQDRGSRFLRVVARLKPGVTQAQAQAEVETIAQRIAQENPRTDANWSVGVVQLHEQTVGKARTGLWIVFGAVGLVLLIACVNVANLLLARADARQKETAIRTALGASRRRLVQQFLVESILLALISGGLGWLLALWGTDLLVAVSAGKIPRVQEIKPDLYVACFTLGVSVLTGMLFGLAPALRATQANLNDTLKEGGTRVSGSLRRNRVRSLLVVSEVAVALVLLIGAGLLIQSLVRLYQVDPGFKAENVLTMKLSLPWSRVQESAAFYQKVLQKIETLPGVQSAGAINFLPLNTSSSLLPFEIEGRPLAPGEKLLTEFRSVSPNYFATLGIPIKGGRHFTDQDDDKAPRVVIINEAFARRFFRMENPVGKRLKGSYGNSTEIVGVVGSIRHTGPDRDPNPEMYSSYLQSPWPAMGFVIRTATAPSSMSKAVRQAVLEVDQAQAVFDIKTMDERLDESVAQRRFNMLLLSIFAAVALLLAGLGIYGVMAYTVTERTHEIGIRMALGAQTSDVLRLVVRQGMMLALIGVAIGLIAAFALTRVMASLLYGVSATDPMTYVGVALLLTSVAMLACYIPARRATKVDPIVALRYE
ncbi:MAG: ABC transporter permease [Pyrinomonadaceae bacterium]|nr:ABC transporter permease [Pyrinomonadaceae bacterium]